MIYIWDRDWFVRDWYGWLAMWAMIGICERDRAGGGP